MRSSLSKKFTFSIVGLLLFFYTCTLLFPFVWIFISSLKTSVEYVQFPFTLPKDWLFTNYLSAFKELSVGDMSFFDMLWNSAWLTFGGSTISVFSCAMTAYVIAKYEFKFRNFLYGLAIFIMLIPIAGNLGSQYKLFGSLHMIDSPLLLLSYTGGFGFNFLILYGFFKSISWNYAEAAFIDGASHFRVFISIMLPQARGSLLSLFILSVVGVWNDYMTPFLYLPNHQTLASGLFRFESIMATYSGNYPVYFAGVLLSIIPIIILFICFSETMMKNTVAGGLKG